MRSQASEQAPEQASSLHVTRLFPWPSQLELEQVAAIEAESRAELRYSARAFNPTTPGQRWYAAFDGERVVAYAHFTALPVDAKIRLLGVGATRSYWRWGVQQLLLRYAMHDLRVKQADARPVVNCLSQ
jgi:hypothetical protein